MRTLKSPAAKIGVEILWFAVQAAVAALWLYVAYENTIELVLADLGTPPGDVPKWLDMALLMLPLLGIGLWFAQYVGTKASKPRRRLIARVGLAVIAVFWFGLILGVEAQYGVDFFAYTTI